MLEGLEDLFEGIKLVGLIGWGDFPDMSISS